MNEVATNLVPYPKLHYIFSSISPVTLSAPNMCITQEAKYINFLFFFNFKIKILKLKFNKILIYCLRLRDEVFTNAWSRNNQLIRLDPLQSTSVILAAAHIARGNTTLTNIKRNIERYNFFTFFNKYITVYNYFIIFRFQNKSKFTSWSRDCMKIGLCSVPPAGHSSSLLCLLNSSAMSALFKDIIREFSKLYKKKVQS